MMDFSVIISVLRQPVVLAGIFIALFLCGILWKIISAVGTSRSQVFHNPLVIDGDTIYCGRRKIRLHGIDAPEIGQRGGTEAKKQLELLINRDSVRVEYLDTDIYDRSIARIHGRKGDLCRLMVSNGYAVAAFHQDYKGDEKQARRHKRGLWKKHGIEDPAVWRRRHPRSGRRS